MSRRLALIGTAGRHLQLTGFVWRRMVRDVLPRLRLDDELVSGGAAWADHLAVHAFLEGRVAGLTLHLPAPIFKGTLSGEAGRVARHYHATFQRASEVDAMADILKAIERGARFTTQPRRDDTRGFFARNALVAADAAGVLAYTAAPGDEPDDGGTRHTWDLINGPKKHVSIRPWMQP